jgi:diguanylate cyclase (GGDEF)-like protein/PAS domain S-box-containing protein
VDVEYRLRRADGAWRHIRQTMEPLSGADAQGKIRWFNTLQDVTERKRTEQNLRDSEARFRQMAENIRDVFFLVDAESNRMLYISPAYEEIWGRSCDSVYANPESWTDAIHPEDRAVTYESYKKGMAAAQFQYEYRIVRPDGSIRWIEARGFPIRDEAGKVYRVTGVAEDVTERKRAAEELRESERRFSDLLSNVEMVSLMLDRDARITYCNDYFLRLTGWQREEVIGQDWFKLFIPPDIDDLKVVFAALLANLPEAWHHENEILTRTGARRLIRWNNSVLRSGSGEPIGTASIGEDITEQKQAEIKIKGLNRVYAVLSGINGLIVRVRDRDELFREACGLAVEAGKFRMAWIGLVDREAMLVKPVAWHGTDAEYIHLMPRGLVDTEAQGRGLAGRVVRERTAITIDDMTQDPRILLRKEALERGFRSLVMLPLMIAEEAVGVLALYAGEIGFFDEEEMKLLRELAGDIAFALEHMQKEDRLRRLTRVNAMLSGINGVIARVRDRRELFQEACRIAVDTGGLRFAWLSIVDEKDMSLKPVASAGADEGFLKMIEGGLSLRDEAPEGHGIGAVAVRERRALIVNDTQSDPRIRHKKGLDERGVHSVAILPLIVAGRVVGSFGLHSGEAGFFDEEEMKVLNELAGNIAFALDHIEKEEKVERLTRVYAVLSGINAAIVRIRDRQELFQEACRIAIEDGKFRMAWLGIVDREAKIVKPVASAGDVRDFFDAAPLAVTAASPGGHGLAGRAVRDKKPMISNDVRNDPQRLMRKELDERGINSLAVIPLIVNDDAIGVLALYAADVSAFDDEEMRLLLELAGDIAFALEHIEKAEKLDYLAYYDQLTGLANRTLFLERVAQKLIAAGSAKKVAVFALDVDRFRGINDALGRQAGDELLKQVADRLTKAGGDESRLARIGGDDFAIVSAEAQNEEQLARLTELRLKECFGSPFRIGDGEVTSSAKVGIAVFPNDGADAGTLLRNAEAAVEKAKASGERYLFYTQEMTERIAEKLSLESKLRQALEKEEFVLHYQPKVDLETRSIVGVEALIRWQSPERGLVPPLQFIPLLEETGLIQQVGSWALRRASLDHRSWAEQGLKAPRVAVNVSAIQMQQRNFVEVIEQAIVEGLAPTAIDLEITESLIMEDIQGNIQKLNSVRALGVNIAIDDFGTGYSSLGYLAKLPVQSLKIDRSFINVMNKDPNAMTLVSTIISLAHSLRLKVIAEGVETEEQANFLRLLRCDEMQGYLFSKPLPMDALIALLRKSL